MLSVTWDRYQGDISNPFAKIPIILFKCFVIGGASSRGWTFVIVEFSEDEGTYIIFRKYLQK